MTIWMWLYSGRSSKRLQVFQADALRVELVAAHRLAGLAYCMFSVLSNALAHWDAKERTRDTPLVTCLAATPTRDTALVTAGERIGEGSDMQCAQ